MIQAVWSPGTGGSGDRIVVGTTGAQPIVLDRDGRMVVEMVKGDMYVTDMDGWWWKWSRGICT